MSKINLNDPTAWTNTNWDDPAPLNIKSDQSVAVARSNKLRVLIPEMRERIASGAKGKPSQLKGKQQAEEHVAKRLATRSANGFVPNMTGLQQARQTRARPVKDDQGNIYVSLAESARAHNIAVGTAQYRIKKGYWSYVTEK